MSKLTDQDYLLSDQYKSASNLDARIQLHQRFSTNKRGWMAWVFDRISGLPPESRILDVGAGPADLWVENVTRVPAGWDVTLTDLSAGMVRQAQDNLRDCGRDFRFGLLDVQAIPFEDGSFDAVIANHMLYHVPDSATALSELHRVLKPGGRLYAATNGHGHLRELRELMTRFDPDADGEMDVSPGFSLENGAEELGRHFPRVTLFRREDALVVTEVEPLIAYLLSTSRAAVLKENLEQLVSLVEREIGVRGAIHIGKDVGMFEAMKGGRKAA